tara:strand:- start:20 stop:565 length:546 start_codon:yes stop_codon:yes gene_type:complete
MRSSSKSRNRNKNGNRRGNAGGNIINRVFESSGPEGRVRGTPQQIIDKYISLAHDSQLSGDRVSAENFQQHAEHYSRILAVAQKELAEKHGDIGTSTPLINTKTSNHQGGEIGQKNSGGSFENVEHTNGNPKSGSNLSISDCSTNEEILTKDSAKSAPNSINKKVLERDKVSESAAKKDFD